MAVIQMNASGEWTRIATDAAWPGGSVALRADGSGLAAWFTAPAGTPGVVNGRLLAADGRPAGEEFLINTTTTPSGGSLVTTALPDGSFVVSWAVPLVASDGQFALHARHFLADGTAAGPEVRVNSVSAEVAPRLPDRREFQVTALDDGDLIFTYRAGGKLLQERFDPASGASGARVVAEAYDSGFTSVGTVGGGGYHVAWQTPDGGGSRLQVFDASGEPVGPQQVLHGDLLRSASLADGSFVVLEWASTEPSRIERFSPTGERLQSFPVFMRVTGAEHFIAMPDGGFAILGLASPTGSGSGPHFIQMQRYDAEGQALDVPRQLTETLAADLKDADASPTGELVLTLWQWVTSVLDTFETSLATYTGTESDDVFVASPVGLRAGVQVNGLGGTDVLMVASDSLDLRGVVLEGVEAIVTSEALPATRLIGTGGNDNVGGYGVHDTMAYGLVRSDYSCEGTLASSIVSGAEGTDTLYGVERIAFRDGSLVREVASAAAAVLRLYEIGLDRAPDSYGFQAWVDALETGSDVFAGIAGSSEFAARYGALDDGDFVEAMYRDGLDRAPDAGGLDHWLGVLEQGGSRSGVLRGFTDSAEAVEKTRVTVEAGLWDLGSDASWVSNLFDAAFGRLPTRGEFFEGMAWTEASLDVRALPIRLAGSDEFAALHGALDDSAFIDTMYRTALRREADADGKAAWLARMDLGLQRFEVLQGFSEAPEHRALFLPEIADGVRFSGEPEASAALPQLL